MYPVHLVGEQFRHSDFYAIKRQFRSRTFVGFYLWPDDGKRELGDPSACARGAYRTDWRYRPARCNRPDWTDGSARSQWSDRDDRSDWRARINWRHRPERKSRIKWIDRRNRIDRGHRCDRSHGNARTGRSDGRFRHFRCARLC